MRTHLYHPRVTFADTNVVGNVYFANYFRWQDECRNRWLKQTSPQSYENVAWGRKRLRVRDVSFEYHDPTGIGVAEPIELAMSVEKLGAGSFYATTAVQRCTEVDRLISPQSVCCKQPADGPVIAKGRQRFELVDDGQKLVDQTKYSDNAGPAYKIGLSTSLELFGWNGWLDAQQLIRWQGQCREQFLIDHAPHTLQQVAGRRLALHTSKVRLELLHDVRLSTGDEFSVEMRLTHLRGGRMTVVFDYYYLSSTSNGINRRRFARGTQSICCKRPTASGLQPIVFPADLLLALREFANSADVKDHIDAALDFQQVESESDAAETARQFCISGVSAELEPAAIGERAADRS